MACGECTEQQRLGGSGLVQSTSYPVYVHIIDQGLDRSEERM